MPRASQRNPLTPNPLYALYSYDPITDPRKREPFVPPHLTTIALHNNRLALRRQEKKHSDRQHWRSCRVTHMLGTTLQASSKESPTLHVTSTVCAVIG